MTNFNEIVFSIGLFGCVPHATQFQVVLDVLHKRRPNPQEPADLVTFTEKILNGKLHLLSIEECYFQIITN